VLASATDLRIITRAIALLISVVSVLGDRLSSCAHKDAHAVCATGLINTAVRVEFIARHMYPHRREMNQVNIWKLFLYHSHASIATSVNTAD
jgi:hypothetical protein